MSEVVFEYTGTEEREDIPKDVTIVRFHSSVKEVDDRMFKECSQLKEVVLNEGLQKIGKQAFYHCKSLESIKLPSTVTEIGNAAFAGCSNLEEVVLNETLRTIGLAAFSTCTSLEYIKIPSTVTAIGDAAFCSCSGLETIILNEGLKKIEDSLFAGCESLECITIPSTVTEISDSAFYNCRSLREAGLHEGIQKIAIDTGDSLERFSSNPFVECSSLERFTFPKLSTRLETIIQLGQTEVEDKIDNIRGDSVERRGSELFVSAVSVEMFCRNWKTRREVFGRIDRLLTYYELREATTLFELAIWKSNIDKAEVRTPINRDVYRIDIPGPVKNTILQYLNFRV